jgi:hypothetical protein
MLKFFSPENRFRVIILAVNLLFLLILVITYGFSWVDRQHTIIFLGIAMIPGVLLTISKLYRTIFRSDNAGSEEEGKGVIIWAYLFIFFGISSIVVIGVVFILLLIYSVIGPS